MPAGPLSRVLFLSASLCCCIRAWDRWGPRALSLALGSYEFVSQSKSHLCEPCGKNGHDSSCSLKHHFNSWHEHLTFLRMEKYRKENIGYSLRVRVRSEPKLPYGLTEAEEEKTSLGYSFSPALSAFQTAWQPWCGMLCFEGTGLHDYFS